MSDHSDIDDRLPCWLPSHDALKGAQHILAEDMPAIDLVGLTRWLTLQLQRGSNDNHENCKVYADALYDMSRLIDELRFEASLAAVYIIDLGEKISLKERADGEPSAPFSMPGMALSLLSPKLGDKPLLTQLFSEPSTPLAGHRVLAGWFTAQLIDSALMRSIAALDCITVLLWSAAGRSFKRDREDNLIFPTFSKVAMNSLKREYRSKVAWPGLYELTDHSCLQRIRPYNRGFVHRRRMPMQLHGGPELNVTFGGEDVMPTVSVQDQVAMIMDFYREVLRVAAHLADEILR
jgi:hypothetical protein